MRSGILLDDNDVNDDNDGEDSWNCSARGFIEQDGRSLKEGLSEEDEDMVILSTRESRSGVVIDTFPFSLQLSSPSSLPNNKNSDKRDIGAGGGALQCCIIMFLLLCRIR